MGDNKFVYVSEIENILLLNGYITPRNKGWYGPWNFRAFFKPCLWIFHENGHIIKNQLWNILIFLVN